MKTELEQALASINETVTSFVTNQKSMQLQLDAIDRSTKDRAAQFTATLLLQEKMKATPSMVQLFADRRGKAVLTLDAKEAAPILQKTTITATGLGFQQTGVMQIDRIPGIVPEARQQLTVRGELSSSPTNLGIVDFVRVSTPMSLASPVPEASTKPENQLVFTSFSEKIRTLATWIPASKQ
jgi:hypothetical protein